MLNEPETSLHPTLIEPLARLLRQAAERTQVIVVSHDERLVGALDVAPADDGDASEPGERVRVDLRLVDGETVVDGQGVLQRPPWDWGSR